MPRNGRPVRGDLLDAQRQRDQARERRAALAVRGRPRDDDSTRYVRGELRECRAEPWNGPIRHETRTGTHHIYMRGRWRIDDIEPNPLAAATLNRWEDLARQALGVAPSSEYGGVAALAAHERVPIPGRPNEFFPPPGQVIYRGLVAVPGSVIHVQLGDYRCPPESWEYRRETQDIVWLGASEQRDPAWRASWPIRREAQLVDAWHTCQEQRRRARLRQERAERAERKATRLLRSLLNDTQRAQYAKYEHFEVIGSLGGRYRISWGYSGNVDLLDEAGELVANFCAHPPRGVPDPDNRHGDSLPVADCMVGQLLRLATDERGFHDTEYIGQAIYNRHRWEIERARIWPDRFDPPAPRAQESELDRLDHWNVAIGQNATIDFGRTMLRVTYGPVSDTYCAGGDP